MGNGLFHTQHSKLFGRPGDQGNAWGEFNSSTDIYIYPSGINLFHRSIQFTLARTAWSPVHILVYCPWSSPTSYLPANHPEEVEGSVHDKSEGMVGEPACRHNEFAFKTLVIRELSTIDHFRRGSPCSPCPCTATGTKKFKLLQLLKNPGP